MTALKVEITSPNGELFNGNCHLAVVPSVFGELGVMVDHEVVVVSLKEGKILLHDKNQKVIESFDVVSGFAEVQSSGKLLILID